jgi:hypothetical protein
MDLANLIRLEMICHCMRLAIFLGKPDAAAPCRVSGLHLQASTQTPKHFRSVTAARTGSASPSCWNELSDPDKPLHITRAETAPTPKCQVVQLVWCMMKGLASAGDIRHQARIISTNLRRDIYSWACLLLCSFSSYFSLSQAEVMVVESCLCKNYYCNAQWPASH